jgi:hypothetical protein
MSVPDTTEDEDGHLDRLLGIINDESQPDAARFEAAKAALPLCHTPIPPKHVETTGEPMSSAEWLRQARAKNLGHQMD